MRLCTPDYYEGDPFGLFDKVVHVVDACQIKQGDCLILWGGEDIATEIYGQTPNKYVYSHKKSARDILEIDMVNHCIANDIPIIGICRGAQLLCALAGGSLAQHIDGHGQSHNITLHDEQDTVIRCNSSHHQMMLPPASAVVLATDSACLGIDEHNKAIKYPRSVEVVWFPTILALGIQPHPEWTSSPKEFNDYCVRKIKQYILKD